MTLHKSWIICWLCLVHGLYSDGLCFGVVSWFLRNRLIIKLVFGLVGLKGLRKTGSVFFYLAWLGECPRYAGWLLLCILRWIITLSIWEHRNEGLLDSLGNTTREECLLFEVIYLLETFWLWYLICFHLMILWSFHWLLPWF